MCVKCDQMNQSVNEFSDTEIIDHHLDLVIEIAGLAREISHNQERIKMLSYRLDQVDVELELREAKETSSLS